MENRCTQVSDYETTAKSHLIFEDDFDLSELDQSKWFPYYLPHWSKIDAAAAQLRIADSTLQLFVEEDRSPWCSDPNGEIRVSGIQTGHFSGPLASPHGQHRFRADLTVSAELPELRLFLPLYCRLEMKARARLNPWNLAALWLIGFEDSPERSGEITLFEAFGDRVAPSACRIGRGIKKLNDPALRDEIDDSPLPIDVEEWHVYAMDWTPSGVRFFVDDALITATTQAPDYPMQLMLNFYDLPSQHPRRAGRQAWFDIDYIRAYRESA